MINAAKKKSFHNNVEYINGVHIPHDPKEAFKLDQQNGNHCLKKAIRLEIQQLMDYYTFHDKGLIK